MQYPAQQVSLFRRTRNTPEPAGSKGLPDASAGEPDFVIATPMGVEVAVTVSSENRGTAALFRLQSERVSGTENAYAAG